MVFCCKIKIGKLEFDAFSKVEIKKTWKKFTETAKIALPKNLYYKEGNQLKPVKRIGDFIKTGDEVVIQLGYNTQLFTEFKGYVSRSAKVGIPYVIECENEMWQLKKKEVSVSIEDATVRQIVEAVAPEYELDCIDEFFGDFSMMNTTPVLVFNEMKRRAGIHTFFRYDKETDKIRLVCGKIYTDEQLPKKQPYYAYGHNIIDATLQYVSKEDARLKVYGSSVQTNGSVIRVEIGENGGDIKRVNYQQAHNKKELEAKLKMWYRKYPKAEGYVGEITTFGFPLVEHGQVVHIEDKIYEERDSKHFVDMVEILVSPNDGYRKYITVGQKFKENDDGFI